MKKTLSAACLLLLMSLTVVCHADSLERHFIVEFEQVGGVPRGSFSIKPEPNTLSSNPSSPADTNNDAGSMFPVGGKLHRLGDYDETTYPVQAISWELIYATQLLMGYKLVMIVSDTLLGAKSYSSVPLEAFTAVDLLLESYWNPDSSLFNPMGQMGVASALTKEDQPVLITSKTRPKKDERGRGQ
ncbi:hypothetical protein [Endozoicomonas sp. 4G]|uniref:hypothetical protein n=1 Tax=Endozoicomonas sp. 4G TaxID=2872754 RepID=UPI002078B7C8|nr:hypothetical protein [Endozoicomonas sp. 4G]